MHNVVLLGSVAGHQPPAEQIPQDIVEKAPPPPQFSKIVLIGPDGDNHVCTPDALFKRWYRDLAFGRRFQSFMDGFTEAADVSVLKE